MFRDADSGLGDPSTGLIVPAGGNIAEGLRLNAFIPWMRACNTAGAEVAGLCTAALFVADTGLVGDARCSPHCLRCGVPQRVSHRSHRRPNRTDERDQHGRASFFHALERAGGREVASLPHRRLPSTSNASPC